MWSLLAVSIVYFAIFVVPKLPHIWAQAERARIAAISAENRHYCTKWGMPPGTQRYLECTLDLSELRARTVQRLQENAF